MLKNMSSVVSRLVPVSAPARIAIRNNSTFMRTRGFKPMNTIINFVPQQEAWVIQRFGRFNRVLNPGFNLVIPVLEDIAFAHNLRERALEIPSQSAITRDNVTLHLDGVLYLRVTDAIKASYGVEDPDFAVKQLAQTTMRAEIGKLSLDNMFKERGELNKLIVDSINDAAAEWGIQCMRYEIRDIQLPDEVVQAMQMQVSAERKKRAQILASEGERESEVNIATGRKLAKVLNSEGDKQEAINRAMGEAEAIEKRAQATAEAISVVASATKIDGGQNAVALRVAEQYIDSFKALAQESTTLMLPANTGDPASMIAQAAQVYDTVKQKTNMGDMSPAVSAKTIAKPATMSESHVSDGTSDVSGTRSTDENTSEPLNRLINKSWMKNSTGKMSEA